MAVFSPLEPHCCPVLQIFKLIFSLFLAWIKKVPIFALQNGVTRILFQSVDRMFDKVFVECVHIAAHTEVITVITVVLTCNMVRRGPWELGTATTAPPIPSIVTQKTHKLC